MKFWTGVRTLAIPKGRKLGLKERVGTKNRGLKNRFFGKIRALGTEFLDEIGL